MPLSHLHLTRSLAVLTLLLLAACTNGTDPKVKVAEIPLGDGEREHLRDREMARALSDAALASDRSQPNAKRYNAAVEHFVLALQKRAPLADWTAPIRIEQPGRDWLITFDQASQADQGHPEWSPSTFTRLIPAATIKPTGCDHLVSGPGLGVPFVLANEDIDRIKRERAFRPRVGIYVPGTALLEFGRAPAPDAPIPVRLRLYNTYNARTARVAGTTFPLAYDVTAAVQMSLDNKYVRKSALSGLIRPDRRIDDIGLFGLGPYDPKKIPVVFVHGLKSDTHIWKNAVNEIFHDPALASRYQPVLFLYPTGLSIPASSSRLREDLRTYRDTWDPDHNDPGMNQMILVGHSMGGLLSRLQVVDSGDELRKAFFTRPIEDLPWLSDRQAAQVFKGLVFQRQSFVQRAVFIATPHRGSRVADIGLVRFAMRLIRLPGDLFSIATQAVLQDQDLLNPALLEYNLLGLRSVDMLSPGHPYFAALEKRPILVPYHSIIGRFGIGTPPNITDGIVPYTSAHLDGAQSELIVPYTHGCTEKTETVQEVVRILKLHARLERR